MNFEYIKDRLERPEFSAEQIKFLTAPIDEIMIEVKPDGVVYCPADIIRLRLNQALGFAQWAVYTGQHSVLQGKYGDDEVQLPGELWIFGKFVSSAVGEYSGKGSMSFTNKIESARSDLLTKLVKNLSIAGELWNKGFRENWLKKYCQQVLCYTGKEENGKKETKKFWIRNDREFSWPIVEVNPRSKPANQNPAVPAKADNKPAYEIIKIPETIQVGLIVSDDDLEFAKKNSELVKNAGLACSAVRPDGKRIWMKK